jgi:hypothetical protein
MVAQVKHVAVDEGMSDLATTSAEAIIELLTPATPDLPAAGAIDVRNEMPSFFIADCHRIPLYRTFVSSTLTNGLQPFAGRSKGGRCRGRRANRGVDRLWCWPRSLGHTAQRLPGDPVIEESTASAG